MTNGRRWLALDADMFGKPFTLDLHHEFGWAGVATWIAFLCACKRSRTPGTFRFLSEADARGQLGILGWELVDNHGKEWTLQDFWLFTGRKKQTRRTRRGREMNVTATHWQHWQEMHTTQRQRERMRRSRTGKRADEDRTLCEPTSHNVRRDSDSDSDITPNPTQGAKPPAPPTNSRAAKTNPRALGTNPRNHHQEAERTPIRDWTGEEPAESNDLRPAIETLRTNLPPPPAPKKRLP